MDFKTEKSSKESAFSALVALQQTVESRHSIEDQPQISTDWALRFAVCEIRANPWQKEPTKVKSGATSAFISVQIPICFDLIRSSRSYHPIEVAVKRVL